MSVLKYKDTDGQWKPLQNASANEGVHVGPNQPTGRENIWINPDEQPPSFQLPADYPIEIGTETSNGGVWRWEKWESGKAVCSGRFPVGNDKISTEGSWFWSQRPYAFPKGLFSEPPTLVTPTVVTSDIGFAQHGAVYSKDSLMIIFSSVLNKPRTDWKVELYLEGRWK